MKKTEAAAKLEEAGAVLERREDRQGETKTGWWQDGVYLAPKSDPVAAWHALTGGYEELQP